MLVDAIARKLPVVSRVPTIIFGADVTHPSPGDDTSPSIAAVSFLLFWVHFNVLYEGNKLLTFLFLFILEGCGFARLARGYQICWPGLCSSPSTRAYPRFI